MNRVVLLPLLLSIGLAAVGCAGGDDASDDAAASAADMSTSKSSVLNSTAVPLKEVSGLGVRTVSGKPQYMAVGDSSTTLLTFDIGSNGLPANIKENDLSSIFPDSDSQWEAVAGDSSGHVFIMNEGEATISVLSSDLKLEHVINLEIPQDNELYASWQRDTNSRGEGMILLSNGHILVAKEKGPSAIIEFAASGEEAAGYTAALALGTKAFKSPSAGTATFTAVKSWRLKSNVESLIGDISELTTDADGTIVILSDQSRAIGRIEKELSVAEDKVDLKQMWNLPSAVDKPEGLQIIDGKPFITCDLKKKSDVSFFSISAL